MGIKKKTEFRYHGGDCSYYAIVLKDGSEEPILNRLANPNYVHNGKRVYLTSEQEKELRLYEKRVASGKEGVQ